MDLWDDIENDTRKDKFLEMNDSENKIKDVRPLSQDDDLFLLQIAEKYNHSFEKGSASDNFNLRETDDAIKNYDGGDFMYTADNLRFVMDETDAPYEEGKNPFPQTDADKEFEQMIINKYHLVTKEMETAE